MTAAKKLALLRQHMSDKSVDYYFVPSRDDHNNEYVPDCWQRRAWLTNFTGSYGEALVGSNKAYLWTDPRYYLQASQELNGTDFQLMKQLQGVAAPVSAWLGDNAFNATVAVDPKVMSMSQRRQWASSLSRVHGELTAIPGNWIDQIWEDQPPLKFEKIIILPQKYTGFSAIEKLTLVRAEMAQCGADAFIVSQLDEIAWLFNIRGNDIPFNPLVISYAIVTMKEAYLFAHLDCVSPSDLPYFAAQNISLEPYDDFAAALGKLKGNVWLDPTTTSWWVELQLDQAFLIEKSSPLLLLKAIKNKTELAGMREAHRLDGIAVVKFLHWLDTHWRDGYDEISAADQLEQYRRASAQCVDLSFPTICGYADHSAIVHYRAADDSKHSIGDQNILLVDSGGQYFDGTTDITRTLHLGSPTAEQKKHFTLVLKGHLALRHTLFPEGICGEHLNPIARLPLWNEGMDFGHGTGHGVGCYLCVHEGPQRIAYGTTGVALKPGMVVSNEPGLYFNGKYGIRIENLCEIVEAVSIEKSATGSGPFYTMADLTVVPYARKLIEVTLLSAQEIAWINEYHQAIFNLLEKDLSSDERMWLKSATAIL